MCAVLRTILLTSTHEDTKRHQKTPKGIKGAVTEPPGYKIKARKKIKRKPGQRNPKKHDEFFLPLFAVWFEKM